jgi:peptidoglycan/LPS O-acetylase OafA/YrhL
VQPSLTTAGTDPAPAPGWRLGHRPGLDGLRAFAVGLVVVDHATDRLQGSGPTGVTVFFVLSGLLITSLLREEQRSAGRVDRRLFYGKRALRLLPALAVMVAVVTLVPAFGVQTLSGVVALTYLTNLVVATGTKLAALQHTWSLAVEEQFYLVWPFVVGACRTARRCLAVAVGVAAAVVVWRMHLVVAGAAVHRITFATDTRVDAVLLGCALALALETGRLRTAPAWLLGPSVAALLGVSLLGPHEFLWWGQAVATVAGVGAVWSLATRTSRPFEARAARWVGKRSYGIYLWDLPLAWLLLPRLPVPTPVANAVVVAAVVVAAALSHRVVEAPFLRLKDRLRGARPAPSPAPAAELAALTAP